LFPELIVFADKLKTLKPTFVMYSIKESTCVCNEEKPLPISTLFTIALLAVILLVVNDLKVHSPVSLMLLNSLSKIL
jgi:hypothetical protein